MKNFRKKISEKMRAITMLLIIVLQFGTASVVLAGPEPAATTNTEAPTADQLFHSFTYKAGTAPEDSKIGIIAKLDNKTSGSWSKILGNVTKFVLAITGSIAFIAFTYSGIYFVTARGNEDQIKKAKEMIYLSILALAIIATSYAFVLGISQLKFAP